MTMRIQFGPAPLIPRNHRIQRRHSRSASDASPPAWCRELPAMRRNRRGRARAVPGCHAVRGFQDRILGSSWGDGSSAVGVRVEDGRACLLQSSGDRLPARRESRLTQGANRLTLGANMAGPAAWERKMAHPPWQPVNGGLFTDLGGMIAESALPIVLPEVLRRSPCQRRQHGQPRLRQPSLERGLPGSPSDSARSSA